MRTLLPLAAALVLLVAPTGCGGDDPDPAPRVQPPAAAPPPPGTGPETAARPAPKPKPPAAPTPERPDGALRRFRKRMETLVDVCLTGSEAQAAAQAWDLLLPEPETWFRATFGHEHAKALAANYAVWRVRIPELPREIRRAHAEGKSALLVERFERAGDELATTFQSIALRKMTADGRTPLYSLRLHAPGEVDAWHLWSFAWVEGKVRFVGRLMALAPIATDPELVERASLRIRDERELRLKK